MTEIMAIINRTPDSFYDKGATFAEDSALARAQQAIADGASIIDVGGVKAGPGDDVDAAEEIDRVIPTIAAVPELNPNVTISVDTWRADVAEAAIAARARLINDTWAGYDPELIEVAGAHRVGYVCSHTGVNTPRTRPHRVHYDDVVADVIAQTTSLAERAVACGVPENKVFIDPTHDFGKNTLGWNYCAVAMHLLRPDGRFSWHCRIKILSAKHYNERPVKESSGRWQQPHGLLLVG